RNSLTSFNAYLSDGQWIDTPVNDLEAPYYQIYLNKGQAWLLQSDDKKRGTPVKVNLFDAVKIKWNKAIDLSNDISHVYSATAAGGKLYIYGVKQGIPVLLINDGGQQWRKINNLFLE